MKWTPTVTVKDGLAKLYERVVENRAAFGT